MLVVKLIMLAVDSLAAVDSASEILMLAYWLRDSSCVDVSLIDVAKGCLHLFLASIYTLVRALFERIEDVT